MGSTNMGNMVGLGCENNFDASVMSFLFTYILSFKIN